MANESNQLLVIKAGQVIDGKSKNVKKDISIVINDNQIVDVKPSGELDIPENLNYKLLDYSDKTVLPGLVDSHVHLTGIGDGRTGDELVTLPDEILSINMANNARIHLQSGVTTVRDCGAKNNTGDLQFGGSVPLLSTIVALLWRPPIWRLRPEAARRRRQIV